MLTLKKAHGWSEQNFLWRLKVEVCLMGSLGKMGHSERVAAGLFKNIEGIKEQPIFKAGVDYFKKF